MRLQQIDNLHKEITILTNAKFNIIEQLQNTKLSKESITELLKKRENVWIKKLETLHPKGLNHELD